MNIRSLLLLSVLLMSTACSMSIPVTKLEKGVVEEGEGALLILPRTELALKYTTLEKTFKAGRWVKEVEACEDVDDGVKDKLARASLLNCRPDSNSDECEAIFSDSRVRSSCVAIAELDLGSKRLSRAPGAAVCPSDTNDEEFRRSFDTKSLAVTGTPVPDPDHIYWVNTPARLFGDTEVTMSYTAGGTVAGAKSASSNPFVTFGVEVAGIGLKSVLGLAGADGAGAEGRGTCLTETDDACASLLAELAALRKLMESEAKFIANITKDSSDNQALLAAKRTQVAEAKAAFEGSVESKEKSSTVSWIPPAADRLRDSIPDPEQCRQNDAGVRNGECIELSMCKDAVVSPVQKLFFRAKVGARDAAVAEVIRPTLESTATGDSYARMKKRGFPYRASIPGWVSAEVILYPANFDANMRGKSLGSLPAVKMAVAQFGEVGFLAPRAGGKSGSIDAKYFVDTGALETLSIKGVGADAAPILDPLKQSLTPSPETDPMKAEKERLETLKAICVAAAALNDPLPEFCKPS